MEIERHFITPIGIVSCGFLCDVIPTSTETSKYKNGHSEAFLTSGHRIEVVNFKIKTPLYNGETVTDSNGWIFRIQKISDSIEAVETYCLFDKAVPGVEFTDDDGECLESIQAYNKDWSLHIGTEDGFSLNGRAQRNDWFPSRLENNDNYYSITERKPEGFITKVPQLYKGEKLHIQYLCALDRRNDEKVNTWLAVDAFKRDLENWIGISE
jgi:hypothetical protein